MQKNPFVTLGVSENVTQNELYEAYKSLKNEYIDKRFSVGEEGALACEKLEEIEQAYRDAELILKNRIFVQDPTDSFKEIEQLIKRGQIEDAQALLSEISNRTAEWYYLQAMVCYCKKWYAETKEKLMIALSMEPNNSKYAEALNRLNEKFKNANSNSGQRDNIYNTNQNSGRSYNNEYQRGGGGVNACNCCSSLICADCCCECMGGDLIACC